MKVSKKEPTHKTQPFRKVEVISLKRGLLHLSICKSSASSSATYFMLHELSTT